MFSHNPRWIVEVILESSDTPKSVQIMIIVSISQGLQPFRDNFEKHPHKFQDSLFIFERIRYLCSPKFIRTFSGT